MKKNKSRHKQYLFKRLEELYTKMEDSYNTIAKKIGLSCNGCEDNCCKSYFQHHTHIEWAYLFKGINSLDEDKKLQILRRSQEYIRITDKLLKEGKRPDIMCPLNEGGRCILYKYRLMICRLHGIPNIIKMPDGILKKFPGCFKCVELTKNSLFFPVMDRTPFYVSLAEIERKFTKLLKNPMPKVDHTLAEMIVLGEPR